jgi:hypothetical protein
LESIKHLGDLMHKVNFLANVCCCWIGLFEWMEYRGALDLYQRYYMRT